MSDLSLLFDNKLDYLIIDNFLAQEQITTFLNVIKQQPEWRAPKIAKQYEHLFEGQEIPKHLFCSQYMLLTLGNDEKKYLSVAEDYKQIWQRVTEACGFDIFKLFTDYLEANFSFTLKTASLNNQSYSPIVVRDLAEEVLAHADFGPFDGKGWAIEQVTRQLAWNIYLTEPEEGGETTIYDDIWEDENAIDDNSYGIEKMDKPVKAKFSVKPGRLVIFNSRNFHAVTKSSHARIAVGGLIGQTRQGDFIAWG